MGGLDKQFALVGGQPVLALVVRGLLQHPAVAHLVIVTTAEALAAVERLARPIAADRLAAVLIGGARRQDSVRAGVAALSGSDIVAIHDGARPFVTAAIVERGLAALDGYDGAVASALVTDTIKRVDAEGHIVETLARAELRAAQTPQFFRRSALDRVYTVADWEREYTDEASLVELHGHRVVTFLGAPENIKITTPVDLVIAEALWSRKENQA